MRYERILLSSSFKISFWVVNVENALSFASCIALAFLLFSLSFLCFASSSSFFFFATAFCMVGNPSPRNAFFTISICRFSASTTEDVKSGDCIVLVAQVVLQSICTSEENPLCNFESNINPFMGPSISISSFHHAIS